ncbi:hypothetical protein QFW80_12420 [Luteimonas sp. M1R5S18]|uniref:O-antigen/teichoic acid export membrane protein n=1 Tax=Luteimonas rhizosphaericola TaxID=3042024 RepID=A0ABT6JKX1_9GAMM|nr:oligosaccharide flippase family protein [Luteimonas rhizosphaericola]MDH5831319.1 hypothetical protein [Luteimonas rhizosphaericola]
MLVWNAARLVTQLAWVLLLARALGPHGYGTFSGLAGLGLALGGFAAFGMGLRLYQEVARDHRELPAHWPLVRMTLAWSGPVLLAIYLLSSLALQSETAMVAVLSIGIAEVVLAPLCTQVAFAYASLGRMGEAAAVPVALSLARVAAALVYLMVAPTSGLSAYALIHAVATLGAVLWVWATAHLRLGLPRYTRRTGIRELRSGFGFSSLWASGLALTSLDKTAAMYAGGGAIAGEYTAGYRLASIAALPVETLTTTIMPRLFRAGGGRPLTTRKVVLLFGGVFLYGFGAGLLACLIIPVLPVVLGEGFAGIVPLGGLLGWWVPAYCLRMLAGNMMLGCGRKGLRVGLELSGLVMMTSLMLVWMPEEGLAGALRALLVAEWMMACVGVVLLAGLSRRRADGLAPNGL